MDLERLASKLWESTCSIVTSLYGPYISYGPYQGQDGWLGCIFMPFLCFGNSPPIHFGFEIGDSVPVVLECGSQALND